MIAPYDVFDDPYCYKGTSCLKNRLGLRHPDVLSAFEVEMTALRSEEPAPRLAVLDQPTIVRFTAISFRMSTAGRDRVTRTVRTAKGGRTRFATPENIASEMNRLFRLLSGSLFLEGVEMFGTSFRQQRVFLPNLMQSTHFVKEMAVLNYLSCICLV